VSLKNDLPAKVVLMLGVALTELQRSEAETDLIRIRDLIANAQSTLTELHHLAEVAAAEADGAAVNGRTP
jgi:hypothetical protein